MGNNTVALLLNDQADILDRRGEQVLQTLRECLRSGRGTDRLGGPGQMQVLPSCHADTLQIIVAGANSMSVLGHAHWGDGPDDILRQLADKRGFRLVKKPSPEHSNHHPEKEVKPC